MQRGALGSVVEELDVVYLLLHYKPSLGKAIQGRRRTCGEDSCKSCCASGKEATKVLLRLESCIVIIASPGEFEYPSIAVIASVYAIHMGSINGRSSCDVCGQVWGDVRRELDRSCEAIAIKIV